MRYEYKQEYCNSWALGQELTLASENGWELVALIGEPHVIQLTSTCEVPDQQVYLLRRAIEIKAP